jgi:2-oxoisovalerate dehydrogenase E2 component (dihydrolipoyl transacylase)
VTDVPAAVRRPSGALAAPAVRRRAADLGIALTDVAGTGPDGRVVHGDLDRLVAAARPMPGAQAAAGPAPQAVDDDVEAVKVIGLRRNIAQRMQESTRRIPHFTYVDEVDVTDLERLRAELNRQHEGARPRLTVLPLLMRAVILAIAEYPQMNGRYKDDDGVIERHRAVHFGVATQTAKGLMVPVVEHAEGRDVWSLAAEVTRLSAAARDGTVTLDELHGSTITITSLGALGGVVTTPVINYPEVAIIGVNKIVTRPVHTDGAWLPRQMMNLSSSFDHRVVDGWEAAQFVQRIKSLLETPALLFVG